MTGNQVALGEPAGTRARVTFTAFRSVDDPMLMAWARFRAQLATTAHPSGASIESDRDAASVRSVHPPEPARASGLWRLLATNNRELGRSFLLYGSFEAARRHVQRLQAGDAELEVTLVAGPFNASHGWIISHDGSAVMTCSRWYCLHLDQRRVRRRHPRGAPAGRAVG